VLLKAARNASTHFYRENPIDMSSLISASFEEFCCTGIDYLAYFFSSFLISGLTYFVSTLTSLF
jgi:hypothetical protein